MLRITGFWANINKMETLVENKGFFFSESVVFFLHFYPRYLTNGNSKAY